MVKFLRSGVALIFAILCLVVFLMADIAALGAAIIQFMPDLPVSSAQSGNFINILKRMPTQYPTPTLAIALAMTTVTPTPFQPLPPTPTATFTFTPTLTPTLTSTPTPSSTFLPLPSHTRQPPQVPASTNTPLEVPSESPTSAGATQDGSLPDSAQVNGVVGHSMRFSLDCEAAAAITLAGFFGIKIDHMDFLDKLPYTDDPDTGFVGSYKDPAGDIPPNSYGVYAGPVAKLLRAYGLSGAVAKKNMTFERIKKEIASGHPVMVWVIGSVQYGTPISYTAASTGNTTIVAAFEHTVLVTGYDQYYVYIQDGWQHYLVNINQFLKSWGVLGNMAIIVNE